MPKQGLKWLQVSVWYSDGTRLMVDLEKLAKVQKETEASFKTLTTAAFDFGPALPKARFPESFVAFYTGPHGHKIELKEDANCFLCDFGDRPQTYMFDGLFPPDMLTSQNGLISESIYAPKDAIILPPMHYAIGAAFGEVEMRILINLDAASDDYGKLYLWHLAHDPLGSIGNDRGLAFLCDNLPSFFAMLTREEEL